MNLTEMITFVRDQADTDSADAPTSNLTVYARAAYNDIRRRIGSWTSQRSSDTLTTVAGTGAYALSGAQFTNANIEYVTDVVGSTQKLTYVPFPTYLHMLEGTTSSSTTEADFFTVDNGVIYLYPTPSSSGFAYSVYGYETFDDWPTVGGEPDLPREFDEPICWFMLSKYFMAQEDLELAQMYGQQYEVAVSRFLASQMRESLPTGRLRGGGMPRRGPSYAEWVRRNTEG